MTEQEWLTCDDPDTMHDHVVALKSSPLRMDLFCLACARVVLHLIQDEGARQAFAWLEKHPGERQQRRHRPGGSMQDLFQGPGHGLYEAHHRRERGVSGLAVHVAYDFWANFYEYAFPNLYPMFTQYPGALREDPRISLVAIIRDIFGNPFRPVTLDSRWLTPTVNALASPFNVDRAFDRLPILADALEEAGCTNTEILAHCRGLGPHVLGC